MEFAAASAEAPDAAPSRGDDGLYADVLHGHIARLDLLIDLGLEAAGLITGRIRAAAAAAVAEEASPETPRPEPRLGLELARVSNGACLAMALQARLIAELREPWRAAPRRAGAGSLRSDAAPSSRARSAPARSPPDMPPPVSPEEGRREVVEEAFERIAQAAHPDDDDAVDRLVHEARSRLRLDTRFNSVMSRPIGETIDLICRALGLAPDWPRLADEALTRDAADRARPGAPPAFRIVLVRPPPSDHPLATPRPTPPSRPDLSSPEPRASDLRRPGPTVVTWPDDPPDPPPPPVWTPPHEGPHVLPGELPPPRPRRRRPYWE